MANQNFHTHTPYCDGKNTIDEMIEQAISCGFKALGFSGHAYTEFDLSYCMTPDETLRYIADINAAKAKYAGVINIYCGTEIDYYSPALVGEYDYSIGSVHYLKLSDEYYPVDSSAAKQQEAADKYFGGSLIAYAERYFELVGDVIEKTGADFIGHFDLVSKFNEGDKLYDSTDRRYVNAWKTAAERLCSCGVPFEINTGAMARGLRTAPYPTLEMARFIKEHGGTFILSSDCHYKDKLTYAFTETEETYKEFGIEDFEKLLLR